MWSVFECARAFLSCCFRCWPHDRCYFTSLFFFSKWNLYFLHFISCVISIHSLYEKFALFLSWCWLLLFYHFISSMDDDDDDNIIYISSPHVQKCMHITVYSREGNINIPFNDANIMQRTVVFLWRTSRIHHHITI